MSTDVAPTKTRTHSSEDPSQGWHARLELVFAKKGFQTRVARRRHQGPLLVQREFPQVDGSCHTYVIHPPGGVAGGDRLEVQAAALAGSHAVITSPAATKLYRQSGRPARLQQHFRVESEARLWWLPQETIAYSGTRASLSTVVQLAREGHYCGWETLCLGEDNGGLTRGGLVQALRIQRERADLWEECLRLEAGAAVLRAPWGLAGHSVCASLLATGADPSLVAAIREASSSQGSQSERFAVTSCGEVLVARYLGQSAERARQRLLVVLQMYSEKTLGRSFTLPRIWAT